MSLEKTVEIGVIEITNGVMLRIREDTIVTEDDVEISRNYHRRLISPGRMADDEWQPTDIADEPEIIQSICAAIWTDESLSKYKNGLN